MKDERDLGKAVIVWPFADAPAELKSLSLNGGDEDWVIFIPRVLAANRNIEWVECGTVFGDESPQRYEVDDGVIYITSHA